MGGEVAIFMALGEVVMEEARSILEGDTLQIWVDSGTDYGTGNYPE